MGVDALRVALLGSDEYSGNSSTRNYWGVGSATMEMRANETGAAFAGGEGALVATLTRFALGRPFGAAASRAAGERLASDRLAFAIAHPDSVGAVVAATAALRAEVGFDGAVARSDANAGRVPRVRWFAPAMVNDAAAVFGTGVPYDTGWVEPGSSRTERTTRRTTTTTTTGCWSRRRGSSRCRTRARSRSRR